MGDPVILAWLGCVGAGGELALPEADSGVFYADVEPALATDCANPSCHGDGGRPLRVYATHRLRMDADDTFRDTPLTAEEHRANFDRARAFLPGDFAPEDSLLLLKPLAEDAGGVAHGAGLVVYPDTTLLEWQALAAWVEGG